jgi:hypothetical protein
MLHLDVVRVGVYSESAPTCKLSQRPIVLAEVTRDTYELAAADCEALMRDGAPFDWLGDLRPAKLVSR